MKAAEIRKLLSERGLAARSWLGQNFLVDPALLAAIPADAGVQTGDRVLEVGPGVGSLTAPLLDAGAVVLAVELDAGLAEWLRERFAAEREDGRLRLLEADVLGPGEEFAADVERWWGRASVPRVVSNLPYAISGPFLGRLPGRPLAGATLLLQREVAEKAAGAGEAGALSVRLGLAFRVRVGRRVPPAVFWPRPQVESAFLHLDPRPDGLRSDEDRVLRPLLRKAFSQRRKRLLPRLGKEDARVAAALEAAGIDPAARPGEVGAGAWLAAARFLMMRGA